MFSYFERLIQPFPPQHPEQPPKTLWAFCRHYTRGMEWQLFWMTLLSAAISLMEVSLFGFMGQLVDWLSTRSPDTLWQEEGNTLIAIGVMILVVLPATVYVHSMLIHQALLGNYPMRIRWLAHRYMLGQSLAFYQNEFAGRIATKVMQTAISVRETVMKLLNVLLSITVYFVGVTVVIGSADVRLCAPLFVWLAIYCVMLRFFVPRLKRIAARQADARSMMTGNIVDCYTNIATVKLFSHSEREADYARSSMALFLDTVHPQMRLVTRLNVCVWLLNAWLIFSISFIGIWLWMQGAITPGPIAVSIGLALRINSMSQWIMWEVSSLFENIGSVQDGINTLSKPRDVLDQPNAPAISVPHGKIEFDHVGFHYGQGSGVIDNLSLTLQPGEKLGIVGRSGAGKSTLVNLLLRFHDVESGAIRIDGQNIAEVKQDSLRANIGMVTQDTSLLHRSVRENILYGRPGASEQEMIEAAKRAEAHNFILQLSDYDGRAGYDARVGERGVKLSGGQRQRIAIARVLLKDAPILVLDEATSALDSEVEAAIQASLYKLMAGKTVIAIAHRLSTIAAMDRLVIMDGGTIVEQGSHAELIARNGVYARLWARQSGGFIGE